MNITEAMKILNKYRNSNYNSDNRDEVELASAMNTILVEMKKLTTELEAIKEKLTTKLEVIREKDND